MLTTTLLLIATFAAAAAPRMPDNCKDLDAQLAKMAASNTPDLVLNTFLARRKELQCPGDPPRAPAPPTHSSDDLCSKIDRQLAHPTDLSGAGSYGRDNLLEHRKMLKCPGQPPAAHVPPPPKPEDKPAAADKPGKGDSSKDRLGKKKKKTTPAATKPAGSERRAAVTTPPR